MDRPFPSFESCTVSIEGVAVHCLVGGGGAPLVLVHGLGSSAGVEFYYNLEALAAQHRVYAVDLPGFGKSDKPSIAYTIEFFVRILRDFLDAQHLERVALMGVSLGGRIALGFALEQPARVSRLILVDALGMGPPRRVLVYSVLLARGVGELALSGTARALRRMNPRLIRRLWGWYLARPGSIEHILSDDRIATHREMLGTPAYRAAYLSALRSVAGMPRMRDGVDVEGRLGSLTMPTLLIWGGHDHIFPPSHAQDAARRIPAVTLRIFEESGHTPQMEEPDRFNRLVLEFLAGR
jgi:pimeloyl-ACP methyl ester carboxylesterase